MQRKLAGKGWGSQGGSAGLLPQDVLMVVWPLLQAAASLGGLQAQLVACRDDAFLATLSPKQLSEVSSKLKTQTRMIFFCESAHTRTKFRSTPPPS